MSGLLNSLSASSAALRIDCAVTPALPGAPSGRMRPTLTCPSPIWLPPCCWRGRLRGEEIAAGESARAGRQREPGSQRERNIERRAQRGGHPGQLNSAHRPFLWALTSNADATELG